MLAAVVALPGVAGAQQQCEYPGVLVVLDRSLSMQGQIDGTAKWDIARDALDTLLTAHGDAADFGLMLYPGPSGSGANGVQGPVPACNYNRMDAGCEPLAPRCTTGEVVVDIGRDTRQAILDATVWPQGLRHSYTPTWQSLEAANAYPGLRRADRRDFVILITDGWQCCGLIVNADGSQACEPEARNLVVEKVAQLRANNIDVFVVGFGGSVDVDTLQRAAVAGGSPRPGCNPDPGAGVGDRCYYQANNAAALRGMLDDIVRRIADELCDGQDNDCDGTVDESLNRACESACGEGQEQCVNGNWLDCDAGRAVPEACDGEDNDCDGNTDENLTRGCQTPCGQGVETCRRGQWGGCDARTPSPEVCDGIDNNCDGTADENCDCRPNETRDCGDNMGRCRPGTQTCEPNGQWGPCEGAIGPEAETCDGEDNDCDGVVDNFDRACNTACGDGAERCEDGQWGPCDAPAPQAETCDGRDQDCDGRTDENVTRACETACGGGAERCEGGAWGACSAPVPTPEVCGNGEDDDCDGVIDDGCQCTDGDTQACGRDRGVCQAGTQTCAGGAWGDCTGAVGGSEETCNGLDDDCDGTTDEGSLCGDNQFCACGGCADACQANECPGAQACTFGFCVEDQCPDGYVCEDSTCVEGDRPDGGAGGGRDLGVTGPRFDSGTADGGTIAGSGASDGCSCDVADERQPSPVAWFALLGLVALRRRRR